MPDRPLAIGLTAVLVVVALVAWRGGRTGRWLVAGGMVLVLVGAGFVIQRHYLERRYAVGAGLRMDPAYEYVNAHEPQNVVPFQTIQFSPFFGPSYANQVHVFAPPVSKRSTEPAVRCREWERAFRRRHVTLIAIGPDGVLAEQPDHRWLERSPSLERVVHDDRSVVYRVHQPLRLACPPG